MVKEKEISGNSQVSGWPGGLRRGGGGITLSFVRQEYEVCAPERREKIIWNTRERNLGLISKVEV